MTQKILETTNYGLFKTIKGNRDISEPQLSRLESSVTLKNLLHATPVIVNEKNEVVDGQHRLLVCKKLNLPVHYVVIPGTTIQEVQMLNWASRPWGNMDFLLSYAKRGFGEYVTVLKFNKDFDINIGISLEILSPGKLRHGQLLEIFKKGEFKVSDKTKGWEMGRLIQQYRLLANPLILKSTSFYRTIIALDNKEIDHVRLLEAISHEKDKIPALVGRRSYLQYFENVYNKGHVKKVRFY